MNKKFDFIKKYKAASREDELHLYYGDKLTMFKCNYKVAAFNPNGHTILEDEKNYKIAIPTSKVKSFLKAGIITASGPVSLFKAMPSPTGKTKQPGGEPIGTIHQGAKGSYKKVSMNPPMWVHVHEGTSHSSPDSEQEHPLSHPADEKAYSSITAKIATNAHADDQEKLKSMVMEYVEAKKKYQNVKSAHNTHEVNKEGQKVSTGVAAGTVSKINNMREAVHEKHSKLLTALKESRAKRLKEGK